VRKTETGTARRYARALLDLALDSGEAEGLREELQAAALLLKRHAELAEALGHPALAADKKQRLVESVWGGRGSPLLLRLLVLLAGRNRLGLLPAIDEAYGQAWNHHRGVVSAEVVSAVALEDGQAEALQAAAERLAGGPVELSYRLEPALLGSLRLSLGGRVYDGSLRGRLQLLRHRLLEGAPGR
jgi:F-type H+-transporting ATPase subunit delta